MTTPQKRYLIDSSVYKKNIAFYSQGYDANTCVETPNGAMLKSNTHPDGVYEQLDKPFSTKSLEKAISQATKQKKSKRKYHCLFCGAETTNSFLIPGMEEEIQVCNNTSCIKKLLTEARPHTQSDYL